MQISYDTVQWQIQTISLNESLDQSSDARGPTLLQFPAHHFSSNLQLVPISSLTQKNGGKAVTSF